MKKLHCGLLKPKLWEEFKVRYRERFGEFPVGIWTEKETYFTLAQLKNGTAPF